MKLKSFSLMLDESGALDDSHMQQELEGCEVLQVWEQFIPNTQTWHLLVGYRLIASQAKVTKKDRRQEHKRSRQRLLEGLDPIEKEVYEILRAWRLNEANQKQLGPHFILTNAQLIEILKRKPSNLNQLKEIKGIGESKSKEHGQSLLVTLSTAWDKAQASLDANQDSKN